MEKAAPAARKRLQSGFGIRASEALIRDTDQANATVWKENEHRSGADLLTFVCVKRLADPPKEGSDSDKSPTNGLNTEGHVDQT